MAWAKPPFPVPPKGGLVQCDADLAICTGDLDSCDATLDTCTTDLATCDGDLSTCQSIADFLEVNIKQCNSDLLKCQANTQPFPATGQIRCWDNSGAEIPCDGTGQDGDIQAGAELSYTDTGLTIIDNNTKLEWMKLDDNNLGCGSYPGSLDKDCEFNWDDAFTFVASLNANNHAGGGWRVPNVKELQSIVNYAYIQAISDEFKYGCDTGSSCQLPDCSCTARGGYWSSTTRRSIINSYAYVVTYNINDAVVDADQKTASRFRHLRAVRGGLID
jgi:hypothetical protein